MAIFSWYTESLKIPRKLQAYLGDAVGSVPMHRNKASHNFAGEESCLQFVKTKKSSICGAQYSKSIIKHAHY